MSKYKLSRKANQQIAIIDKTATAVALIKLEHRHIDEKGGISHVKVVLHDNGVITKNNRARRDGEQLEVAGVVITLEADTSDIHTQFSFDKIPMGLQVIRHEHYLKALKTEVRACA